VANADPQQMVHTIDHMPRKVANQITAAAKVSNLLGLSKRRFMTVGISSSGICIMEGHTITWLVEALCYKLEGHRFSSR
jgi:hypothetical protein